ncbi:MAG TPA: hypothetical protein PLB88_11125, partial [Thermoanaerobaculaceae bacterium]|nr:hypothetical protein [Thermoanaerobaculaceae bacterium]
VTLADVHDRAQEAAGMLDTYRTQGYRDRGHVVEAFGTLDELLADIRETLAAERNGGTPPKNPAGKK